MPPLRSLYVTPPSDTPTMGPVTMLQRLRDMYESLLPKDFPPTQMLRDYVLPTSDVMPMTTMVPGGRIASATAAELEAVSQRILQESRGKLAVLDLRPKPNGGVELETIATAAGQHGQGAGTEAMAKLTKWADEKGVQLTLSPSNKGYQPVEGAAKTTSTGRLKDFYSRFGFKDPTSKRYYDPALSSPTRPVMYRPPAAQPPPQAAPAAPQTLKAFHGSPHDFDQFKASAIGSGEGGQAYGYGHYFAQNPEVAKAYRDQLSGRAGITPGASVGRGKLTVNGITQPEGIAGHRALDTAQDIQGLLYYKQAGYPDMADVVSGQIERRIANWKAENPQTGIADTDMRALADYYETHVKHAKPEMIKERPPGRTYELNLHTSPESLLDWDKPLSQQPQKVIDWLRQSDAPFGYKAKSKNWRGSGALPEDVWLKSLENTTGEELYRALVTPLGRAGHTEGIASQQLADAGIHGVQYLDQGSRAAASDRWLLKNYHPNGEMYHSMYFDSPQKAKEMAEAAGAASHTIERVPAQEGTRNYVIFPHFEHLIEISKKYGISLPAAASLYKWQQSQKGVE